MSFLVAALAAPILGPVLYALLHRHGRALRSVDTFVYLAVPALVAWQVLPHVIEDRSALLVVAVGVGLLVPSLFERLSHALEAQTDNLAIIVGLSGLLVHALLEGAALAPLNGGVDPAFGLAVALHRVPVGLIIWWLLLPRHGPAAAVAGVGSVVLVTWAGYVVGTELAGAAHGPAVELYQAFVSGSLVHVVFHQGRHDHDHAIPGPHDPHEHPPDAHHHPHDHRHRRPPSA